MSDYRYNRVSGEYRRYKAFGRHAVLAWRMRGGWVKALESASEALTGKVSATNSILHPRKRFYAGGAQSVRGYGENQLGPRVLTIDPAAAYVHYTTNNTIFGTEFAYVPDAGSVPLVPAVGVAVHWLEFPLSPPVFNAVACDGTDICPLAIDEEDLG